MFKRRNLFKSLIGLFLAPKVVEALPLPKETVSTLGFKGREFFKTGIVYAPYTPLLKCDNDLALQVSLEMQKSIDSSMIKEILKTVEKDLSNKMPM